MQKWSVLALSQLLGDATHREWCLPWQTALQPLQLGAEDMFAALEGLSRLLVAVMSRCAYKRQAGPASVTAACIVCAAAAGDLLGR